MVAPTKQRKAWARRGRCPWCGAATPRGQTLCDDHTAYQRERYAEARAEGQCTVCGSDDAGEYWACETCRGRKAEARRARRSG